VALLDEHGPELGSVFVFLLCVSSSDVGEFDHHVEEDGFDADFTEFVEVGEDSFQNKHDDDCADDHVGSFETGEKSIHLFFNILCVLHTL